MQASDVLDLLDLAAASGIRVWVAGGWAVDAVVGRQTREHGDLDMAVDAERLDALLAVLAQQGFRITVDWLPSRAELAAPDGRRVDLHPVAFGPDGHGIQAGHGGPPFEYPADAFSTGTLGGRGVPCLSVAQQLRFREGYPAREIDVHDVALLRAILEKPGSAPS